MNNEQAPINCPFPNCGAPIRNIPAGISKKSGKPYDEFWACLNRDCNYVWKPDKNTGYKKPPTEKEPNQEDKILKAIGESEDRIMGALRELYKRVEERIINI